MQDYSDTTERLQCLNENIKELEKVNKQLSKLTLRREELTKTVIGLMEHDHEGQKTYEHDIWKIEIKTPCIYSLNKKMYESGECQLPEAFNPIKASISYSIDKRLCDSFMQDAPTHVRNNLIKLIDKKPGKASITIKGRV